MTKDYIIKEMEQRLRVMDHVVQEVCHNLQHYIKKQLEAIEELKK